MLLAAARLRGIAAAAPPPAVADSGHRASATGNPVQVRGCRATVNGEQPATGHWGASPGKTADLHRSVSQETSVGAEPLQARARREVGPSRGEGLIVAGLRGRGETSMARRTVAVSATLTACGLFAAGGVVVASAATPQTAQARAALGYLYAQVQPDGSIAELMGATEDTVISAADNGYDPATLRNALTGVSAYSYLSSQVSTIKTAKAAAKYVLTWLAAGRPVAIDATAVLARLNKPNGRGGYLADNGTFHSAVASSETANAYSQSLAVLADLAAGLPLPAHATEWLTCAQRPGGGFGYAITATTAAPPAFCGAGSSDTNDTAIVLEALGRARIVSADRAAQSYLHAAQLSGGGFGFKRSALVSDPDSDAVVIQSLVAIGQDPASAQWTRGGSANPITDLESFADPAGSGGYAYLRNAPPDAFTTTPIPQALALHPYGATTSFVAGSSPPPVVIPSPSPSPAPGRSTSSVPVPATGAGGAVPAACLLFGLGGVALAAASRRPPPTK